MSSLNTALLKLSAMAITRILTLERKTVAIDLKIEMNGSSFP